MYFSSKKQGRSHKERIQDLQISICDLYGSLIELKLEKGTKLDRDTLNPAPSVSKSKDAPGKGMAGPKTRI